MDILSFRGGREECAHSTSRRDPERDVDDRGRFDAVAPWPAVSTQAVSSKRTDPGTWLLARGGVAVYILLCAIAAIATAHALSPEKIRSIVRVESAVNQRCNDDRDVIAREYADFGVDDWQPGCREFANTGGSRYFTWRELNGGFSDGNPHEPWGYVDSALVQGLDLLRDLYGEPVFLSSGYRCPHGNKNVGSRYLTTSRHIFGLAADIYTGGSAGDYEVLRSAAEDAGAQWISGRDDYADDIIHVQWRQEQ